MSLSIFEKKRFRKDLGKIPDIIELPNMIVAQFESYKQFLQTDVPQENRKDFGLNAVFKAMFPITSYNSKVQVEYISYKIEKPRYTEDECRERGLTYFSSVKVTLRMVFFEQNDNGNLQVANSVDQEISFANLPLMTNDATFIFNGVEKVIVSQIVRSPGVFFAHDNGRTQVSGKKLYSAKVIPYAGAWIDFEFDVRDVIYVRIDRKRKVHATTLLMMLPEGNTKMSDGNYKSPGMSNEEILSNFYKIIEVKNKGEYWEKEYNEEEYGNHRLQYDLVDAETEKIVAKSNTRLNKKQANALKDNGLKWIKVHSDFIVNSISAQDIVEESGLVVLEAGETISRERLVYLMENFPNIIQTIKIISVDTNTTGLYICNTLMSDKNRSKDTAIMELYKSIRSGEQITIDRGHKYLYSMLFDQSKYDLSFVGRTKLNARLNIDVDPDFFALTKKDLIAILKKLHDIRDNKDIVDDVDNLSNRRVRSSGELLEHHLRNNIQKLERMIKDKLSIPAENIVIADVISSKNVDPIVKEFFGLSRLAQFMDQVNPLSEITHKRRLSALGPGGLNRDHAGFEVRDVHPTHYGRICPVETPEGANIGLINSLSSFARINEYGFIEAPYRRVVNGKVTNDVVFLSAFQENNEAIAQANIKLDKDNNIVDEFVVCRKNYEVVMLKKELVTFIDVSTKQLSVSACLIPFVAHNDAIRMLMGCNMQRQALPLIKSEAPLIGTGMERPVAMDSGAILRPKHSGTVRFVDSKKIIIQRENDFMLDVYDLRQYRRSNHNTCINQKPIVKLGDFVKKGDVIADGQSTDLGELAVGKNVIVAFNCWHGYNFEDAIIVSEKLAKDERFTSTYIEEFELAVRDTKLGNEEITREIPNVSDESVRNLDETGIVYVGAHVYPGDILVGKVTPKGEHSVTPEEKLLRAIFGERIANVRDSSLYVPSGTYGIVIDVKIFHRFGVDKIDRAIAIERMNVTEASKAKELNKKEMEKCSYEVIKNMLIGNVMLDTNRTIDDEILESIPKYQWKFIQVKNQEVNKKMKELVEKLDLYMKDLDYAFNDNVEKMQNSDELPVGVLKIVKVYVATKRKILPGDKLAGRYGNKGVVSIVAPVEDMPYMEDGTPVDIILNPLGIPSRMNIGQVLEVHLGWASFNIGKEIYELYKWAKVSGNTIALRDKLCEVYDDKHVQYIKEMTDDEIMELAFNVRNGIPMSLPPFDSSSADEITEYLKKAKVDPSGQVLLYDGRTGEAFDNKTTVGIMYIMKLVHMVESKMHARSIGPYSLITQQPLGGRSQSGGQRVGEMEVWALESHGAAHTLLEILTVKSDDIYGRIKTYEAVVRGEETVKAHAPESFKVLIKELRSLGLDVSMLKKSGEE